MLEIIVFNEGEKKKEEWEGRRNEGFCNEWDEYEGWLWVRRNKRRWIREWWNSGDKGIKDRNGKYWLKNRC